MHSERLCRPSLVADACHDAAHLDLMALKAAGRLGVPGGRGRGGLSVPEKVRYVLEHSGRASLLLAAAASAMTWPLGVHGVFCRVADHRRR